MTMAARFILSKIMDANGIGQSEFAAETGLSFATIHRIYNDKTEQVSLETIDRILRALRRRGLPDIDVNTIIEWR